MVVQQTHGVREHIGNRPYMEDRYVIKLNFYKNYNLFGVMDGHGGEYVSEYCKTNLPHVLSYMLRIHDDISIALTKTFEKLHFDLPKDVASNQGTTCLIALVGSNDFWIANTGDSRAIMNDMLEPVQITKDHKPSDIDEYARIEKHGGRVSHHPGDVARVNSQLAVSRAIGDLRLYPLVIPTPEIYHVVYTPTNDFLILATDGLFDGLSNKAIVGMLMEKYRHPLTLTQRINISLDRILSLASDYSFDNITMILIHLKK
jgi:protein phosphatase 1L